MLPDHFNTEKGQQFLEALKKELTEIFLYHDKKAQDNTQIKDNRKAFIDYLCRHYAKGASGASTLIRALYYCKSQPTKKAQATAYETLCTSLEEARIAYRTEEKK